jgi:hypothetical protein
MLSRAAGLALVLSLVAGCGPTFVRGPQGWKMNDATYTIAPAPDGKVLPAGWKLANYDEVGDGYRKHNNLDKRDIQAKRTEDDGILVIVTEEVPKDDLEKKLPVLAEHWLAREVVKPEGDEDTDLYWGVVPPLVTTGTVSVGWRTATAAVTHGRDAQIVRQGDFTVPGAAGYEAELSLVPTGASGPDRRLYLAVIRPPGEKVVMVAYGNTVGQFASGLADAEGLAHRLRF